MTARIHEGQEVEVLFGLPPPGHKGWRKAKIVNAMVHKDDPENDRYEVQFPDFTRAVFDAGHIRAVSP